MSLEQYFDLMFILPLTSIANKQYCCQIVNIGQRELIFITHGTKIFFVWSLVSMTYGIVHIDRKTAT